MKCYNLTIILVLGLIFIQSVKIESELRSKTLLKNQEKAKLNLLQKPKQQ